jgi:hypothetical protein
MKEQIFIEINTDLSEESIFSGVLKETDFDYPIFRIDSRD